MEIQESGSVCPEYSRVYVKTEEPSGMTREEVRFVPEEYHLSVQILPCPGKSEEDPGVPRGRQQEKEQEYRQQEQGQEYRQEFCCTPSFLPEMVLGHLLTEGLILSGEDVISLEVFRDRGEARAVLRECAPFFSQGQTADGTGRSVPEKLPPAELRPADLHPEPLLRPEWIRGMEERVMEETELRALTHAVHSAVLSHRGEIVFAAEDIGRHNAIDKAAGFALRNGIPLGECLLYTTGRMPSDMVMKAVRAGIPVLAGGKGPTAEGLRAAKKYGLVLAGNIRNGKISFY